MASSSEGGGSRAASVRGSLSPALLASWRGGRLCTKLGPGVGEPQQVTAGPAALVLSPERLLPPELPTHQAITSMRAGTGQPIPAAPQGPSSVWSKPQTVAF